MHRLGCALLAVVLGFFAEVEVFGEPLQLRHDFGDLADVDVLLGEAVGEFCDASADAVDLLAFPLGELHAVDHGQQQ